jgi:hypothetical protein
MSRVIAVVACGITVAACSASMPLNFLSSSPPTEVLRFESEPPGAEVKTSSGQTCRTPCELAVQVAPELSTTFALNGYQPQTVSVRSEASSRLGSPRLAPNPVYAELRPAAVAPPAKKRMKRIKNKPAVAAVHAKSPVASAAPPAPPAPPAMSAAGPPAPETAASATNYPWPAPPAANRGK